MVTVDNHAAFEPLDGADRRHRLLVDDKIAVQHAYAPNWASAIAMSASVPWSMAEDSKRNVERNLAGSGRCWCRRLGSTEDSSGCSSTSSKVRPKGMSEAMFGSAISAMPRTPDSPMLEAGEQPLRRLDVHALDHCIVRTARRRRSPRDQPAGAVDFGLGGGEGA